jgi:O-antigen ligase
MTKNKIAQTFLYLWLLIWPWQTKLILRTSDSAYLEISLFLSLLILLVPLVIWTHQIFTEDYFRFKKGMSRPSWWRALIVWELITFASIFWAHDFSLAIYRYLILVFGIFLFYIIKNTDFVKERLVIRYFLIGLIPSALLAAWQFFTQSTIASKYFGLAYHGANILGDSVIETSAGRFLRAYGSFDHPNILGGMMVIGIILVLYSSLKKEINRNERLFYLISFSIFYLALLVSFSRAACLALLISAPFILLSAWRRGRFQKKLIALFIILIIGISAALIIPNQKLFTSRLQANSRLEIRSVSEREKYLDQSKQVIIGSKFLGVGVGNYILELQKIIPGQASWYYQPVHNYWLLIWAELGFFGLLAMVIFWLAIFKKSFRNGLYPIVLALFVFSLFDHWLWTQPFELIIFFGIIGLIFRDGNLTEI